MVITSWLVIGLIVILAAAIVSAALGVVFWQIVTPLIRSCIRVIQWIGTLCLEIVRDLLVAAWNIVVAIALTPAIVGSLLLGRWEAAGSMTRQIGRRFRRTGRRVAGLLTKPADEEVVQAHRTSVSRKSSDQFPGWHVVGALPSGGSGASLHIAEPTSDAPPNSPDRVVIKCFDLTMGSPLSQMIRESRALGGAKRLGLVIDHDLDETRFWYVMRFIPGVHLADAVEGMHAGDVALSGEMLATTLSWARDVTATLHQYHEAGFWHKDVKPENIITNDTGAHLVDLGLVTPLQSAMTLTTHGTEYFRDPELVRQALRGAKVSEVDGAKFDLYSTGAVLYFMVEGTFPAHGNLSRFDRETGDAVRWVIRRAMADYQQRYASASELLADLTFVASAKDPRAVRPADLPSFTHVTPDMHAPPPPTSAMGASVKRPRIEVTDWWTGAYRVLDAVPGMKQKLPNAFSNAIKLRDERRAQRESAREARRARRRASNGGFFAFLVGLLILTTSGYFFFEAISYYASAVNPMAIEVSHDVLPGGEGRALVVNDHPRRVDSMSRVEGQLKQGGWECTSDASLEATFRGHIPFNGTESADFPERARGVMREHALAAAAVISAPSDDPNGVEVVFVTPETMRTYRLQGLAAESLDVQSSP
ncbi:MAG: hypothetical protein MK100_07165 [Phycisphaerales bacterium]|nr:hypothetical protein [Phycisphaerales bacterium]